MPGTLKKNVWKKSIVRYADEAPDSLLANPQNFRLHPEEQKLALNGSLSEIGWISPVIVNEVTQHVIDGHARIGEAIARGEPSVPVAYVHLTEEQERIALASYDAITNMAGIDQSVLDELIASVNVSDTYLSDFLASLTSAEPSSVPGSLSEDEIPEAPSTPEPVVKTGDLWTLGDHRLLCADSTDPKNIKRLFGKSRAVLCMTSPPYWVGRDYEQEHGQEEIVQHIERAAAAITLAMAERSKVVINTGTTSETRQGGEVRRVWLLLDWWQQALLKHKWNMRNVRIWTKEGGFAGFAPAQDLTGQDWEFLADFTSDVNVPQNRLSDAPRWALDGVWDCQPQTASVGHSAPFPVEIPRRYVLLYTQPDDIVYEPYCGSGTTIIAADQLGRRCYAADSDPNSVQLAIERYKGYRGQDAVREDGVTWSELCGASSAA